MFEKIKIYNLEEELEELMRFVDSPVVLSEDKKTDIHKEELERLGLLASFCRGVLCGIKVGRIDRGRI